LGWHLHVDRGGTFTDVVGRDPSGRAVITKHLSASPGYGDPIVHAVEGRRVDELRIGTTVATNALLERKGARVLLLTTRGFGDLLSIGTQERPDIFALAIQKQAPLHAAVVELDERVLADGTVERALDPAQVAAAVEGWDHVAVCLLHATTNPEHERLAGAAARAAGVAHVTLSHEAAPLVGAVARGDTTEADAYLTPGLATSVADAAAQAGRTLCMQSSGGLVAAEDFRGKDAVLSGPAGGVVGAREAGRLAGARAVVGFDMGGTSTDVCRVEERLEPEHQTKVAGVTVAAPTLGIATVAAGGGSVLSLRDGLFAVGPESAGADPGPACYGRGGPATVTDANLVLGRLHAGHFPHLALDEGAAREALSAFGEPREAAAGFLTVAVEAMAAAIRRLSVARGYDVREHVLVAFGGAGGGHACAVARALGMTRALVHPLAGVLSAWGISLARVRRHAARPVRPGEEPDFPVNEALAALAAQGLSDVSVLRWVDVRCRGQDATLSVPWTDEDSGHGDAPWRQAFHEAHARAFGFTRPDAELELVTARVEAEDTTPRAAPAAAPEQDHAARSLSAHEGVPVFVRDELESGARLKGPALVVEDHATTVVDEGWSCRVDGHRQLVLQDGDPDGGDPIPRWPACRAARSQALATGAGAEADIGPDGSAAAHDSGSSDPVTLAVLSSRFMAIAEQMGEQLRRTAHSTNIKERLDFSCALFDGAGQLVANAPHIPVHLGAMGATVRHILASCDLQDGDAWVSNDPRHGGSHLPDITVVSPVFREGRLRFFVANRGHHADVGGAVPGSMPATSTRLAEEGAVLDGLLLVRGGELLEANLSEPLDAAGTRDLGARLADLAAQAAANAEGARQLHALCDERGTEDVSRWMAAVLDHGEAVMADVVAGMHEGRFEDTLDDGSVVAVSVRREGGKAVVDFAGTAGAHPGNRNAPRAVARAATLYVFRTLAGRPIPLNEGCARVLDIRIPRGCLLDPPPDAAVVGGNVETSQRVVDVLYGALDVLAASQGTMNNLTFGDGSFGAYETLCGGAGAGLGFDGADAVHTHMTNTRITDPEVMEQRMPVIVRRFAVRAGSGGRGVWRGGDGVVRELEFRRPLEVNLLAERRTTAPFGLRAEAGARAQDELSTTRVTIQTPGGGGYTPSLEQWAAMPPAEARRLFREGRWTGPTAGIAEGAVRAQLLVVAARDVDRVLAELPSGATLLHRGDSGDAAAPASLGAADLTTDLPLYVRQEPRQAPREAERIQLSAHEVCLLVAAPGDADLVPEAALPHARGAPGRRFLGDPSGSST
jgi:5-oxoprolinase (ATP-hydrolysing)